MNKTAQNTTNSAVSGHPVAANTHDSEVTSPLSDVSGLTGLELQAINEEKLAAICLAIERGHYDSNAILEKALGRMLERLEESENEQ